MKRAGALETPTGPAPDKERNDYTKETTMKTNTSVRDDLIATLVIDEDDVLTESGNDSTGFWHNEIRIDLEKLSQSDLAAFRVVTDIHDTAGTSFREHYGIVRTATLPDGVKTNAILDFCLQIWEQCTELTAGFSVEWISGNETATWADDVEGAESAQAYWEDDFSNRVNDLSCLEVYDLSNDDNLPFVYQNLLDAGYTPEQLRSEADILTAIADCYESDEDCLYTNEEDAAVAIVERYAEDE